jgi:hypothetical protein
MGFDVTRALAGLGALLARFRLVQVDIPPYTTTTTSSHRPARSSCLPFAANPHSAVDLTI